MSKLKTASVLAFERKLANSDGKMYAGNWQQRANSTAWPSIKLQEKSVRGVISNRQKSAIDPVKFDQQLNNANLQTVDAAALPFDCDTLKVSFTLRVLGNLSIPSACNSPEYQQKLSDIINGYKSEVGFALLAQRYAENIANGRFLWRNRFGANMCEVHVTYKDQAPLIFNALDFSLREFGHENTQLKQLAQIIQTGLESSDTSEFLKVNAFVQLGEAQEVFPSQELILDKQKGAKSKVLYELENGAAMHSQKIGNALRTIDTWHPGAGEVGPIAVETYGAVTSRGTAYRARVDSGKVDFFTLLDQWVLKDIIPPVEQQHFVVATFIRGGVFGASGKE